MNKQLPLSLPLDRNASLTQFIAGPNGEALHSLKALINGEQTQPILFWGSDGCGKSHLLQAACLELDSAGLSAVYLPLQEVISLPPQLLEGLEGLDLVAIDDLQLAAGNAAWEEALFDLYNRLKDSRTRLLLSCDQSPSELPLQLPDLRTRLAWGLIYPLKSLSDEEKLDALRQRAEARGLTLAEDVGRYLIRRAPRDLNSLFSLLERLDQASLAAQRRLTVPFVRTVMQDGESQP